MTRLGQTAFVERIGVSHVDRVCAHARVSFRTLPVQDVGIDGLIEVLEEGVATGVYIGVQIKAGESFISSDGSRYTFKADQDHFGYWARCPFLVIGVVVDPAADRAVWVNLSDAASDERIRSGPFSIGVDMSSETQFTPDTLNASITKLAPEYLYRRRTLDDIRRLLVEEPRHEEKLQVPTLKVRPERLEAWRELIHILTDVTSDWEAVADAGYRLSWYYPSVSVDQQAELTAALAVAQDNILLALCCAISELIFTGDDGAAELIGDLLRYVPDVTRRLEGLLAQARVSPRCIEGTIQVIEYLDEGPRPALWEKYGAASTGGPK